jgi:hypothetical protein
LPWHPWVQFHLGGPAEQLAGALGRRWNYPSKLKDSTREKQNLQESLATKPRAPQNVRKPYPGQKMFKEYRFHDSKLIICPGRPYVSASPEFKVLHLL